MIPRTRAESKNLAYFGMKFEMIFDVSVCRLQALATHCIQTITDNKVHGANMVPTWVLSAPDGPHVGPLNLALRGLLVA